MRAVVDAAVAREAMDGTLEEWDRLEDALAEAIRAFLAREGK